MPRTIPNILIISLEKDSWQSEMTERLYAQIRSKARVVEAETEQAAYEALATGITAVLVGDAAITRLQHRELANALVAYAKDGGTVLLGLFISGLARPDDFNGMMRSVWSLPWRFGSYSREDSFLNETTGNHRTRGAQLPDMINVKAVYLRDVANKEKMYVRGERITPRTITQQLLEQYEQGDETGEAAVAFGSVGKGYLGWVGDVNLEEELDSVYLALLGLRDSETSDEKV